MTDRPLLVFDFDGVIVDGMQEYWWSACRACRLLPGGPSESPTPEVPQRFRQLRPWVHHGWEMVLQAAEVEVLDPAAWIADYPGEREKALRRRGWSVPQLQDALDRARADAVTRDRSGWLALHRPFPGVVERLRALVDEGADWAVLTTKSETFTAELLDDLGLHPWRLYGREAGAKPEVLLRLQRERPLRAFLEDRRATLETVRATPAAAFLVLRSRSERGALRSCKNKVDGARVGGVAMGARAAPDGGRSGWLRRAAHAYLRACTQAQRRT